VWPTSISNLKILAIPIVNPESEEEHRELLRVCDAKGVEVEEFAGQGLWEYVAFWEDLTLA
jgi:hypothetical protein